MEEIWKGKLGLVKIGKGKIVDLFEDGEAFNYDSDNECLVEEELGSKRELL